MCCLQWGIYHPYYFGFHFDKVVIVLACKTSINFNCMKNKSSDVEFHSQVSYKQNLILDFWCSFLVITRCFCHTKFWGYDRISKFPGSQVSVCGTHCMHLVTWHFLSILCIKILIMSNCWAITSKAYSSCDQMWKGLRKAREKQFDSCTIWFPSL